MRRFIVMLLIIGTLSCVFAGCAPQVTPVPAESSDTKPSDTTPSTTADTDTEPVKQRNIEELRELVPNYFMTKSFKGIELYVKRNESGELLCAVMPGTNRMKSQDEIDSLTYITLPEMKSIFDECHTDLTEVFAFCGRDCIQELRDVFGGTLVGLFPETYDFFNFNDDLMKYVEEINHGSYAVSPISLEVVLGMLAAGADKETYSQIYNALGTESNYYEDYLKNFSKFTEGFNNYALHDNGVMKLETVNSAWRYNKAGDFLNDYKLRMEAFNAELKEFDYDTVISAVNKWCKDKTHDLIPAVLPDNYDTSNLTVVLINALYYKNEWAHSFVKLKDKLAFMTIDGNEVEKNYFTATEKFKYYKDDKTCIVVIPMKGGVDMVLVKGDVTDLSDKLNQVKETELHVLIPEFSIETSLNNKELIDFLTKRGMVNAFNQTADFSKMINEDIYVSDIIQKTVIDVNNGGVEAAAVTAVMAPTKGLPSEIPVEVYFDSTFHFYLTAHNNDWTAGEFVLFEGRVAD